MRIVLPRIFTGRMAAIDQVIDLMRRCGSCIIVDSANSAYVRDPCVSQYLAIHNLVYNLGYHEIYRLAEDLTPTVNIEGSVIEALTSDITHGDVAFQPWFTAEMKHDIVEEYHDKGIMTRSLYPALVDRDLVCTEEESVCCNEYVQGYGTDNEKARFALLFDLSNADKQTISSASRIEAFRRLSNYHVPENLRLPVRCVSYDVEKKLAKGKIQGGERRFIRVLPKGDWSIIAFVWAKGITTISCEKRLAATVTSTAYKVGAHILPKKVPVIWQCPVKQEMILTREYVI